MGKIGAVFEPELVKLMESALDGAAVLLLQGNRVPNRMRLASRILAAAAKGERDPVQLQIAALLEIEEDQEYDLDRCLSQLLHLQKQAEQSGSH